MRDRQMPAKSNDGDWVMLLTWGRAVQSGRGLVVVALLAHAAGIRLDMR